MSGRILRWIKRWKHNKYDQSIEISIPIYRPKKQKPEPSQIHKKPTIQRKIINKLRYGWKRN